MSHGDPTPLLQRRNDYTNKSIHLIFVVKRERTHKRITARSRIFLYFHSPHHQRNAFASASSFVFGGKTLEARNNNSTTASAAATNRFVSLVPFIAFYFHSVGWTIERCHIHSLWSGIELREYKHWLPLFRSLFHCRPLPAVPAATCNRCVCVCFAHFRQIRRWKNGYGIALHDRQRWDEKERTRLAYALYTECGKYELNV